MMSFYDKPIPDIVIYHARCPDGLAGAWCFFTIAKNAKYISVPTGAPPPPDIKNSHVVIVDMAFSRNDLLNLKNINKSVWVYDHHKSNQRDLADMSECVFDMSRSGAQIAWDVTHGGSRPWFIDYIGARDLYRLDDIKYCAEVTNVLHEEGHLQNFDSLNALNQLDSTKTLNRFINKGKILAEHRNHNVKRIAQYAIKCLHIQNGILYTYGLVYNCPKAYVSDVGHELYSKKYDFVVFPRFSHITNEWWISMRGKPNLDLTKLNLGFGNPKGHPCACGGSFSADINPCTYFKPSTN